MTQDVIYIKNSGPTWFLSNFAETPFTYRGKEYLCAEAAFQAQKTLDKTEAAQFCQMNGKTAQQAGQCVTLRDDWEDIKDEVMEDITLQRFKQNSAIKQELLSTGNSQIVERNNWGDTYWGICHGTGQNKMGQILMKVRGILASES